MSWFVGIDGGGTRATAVLTDAAGEVRTRMEGSAGRVDVLEPAAVARSLADLAGRTANAAGVQRITALCCGLAGAGREPERTQLEDALRARQVAETVIVTTDALAALQDALGTDPGILVISGTGSVGWGRGENATMQRTGGWGQLLGDEGSGYAIGLAALRATMHAHDGRIGETALRAITVAHAKMKEPEDLVRWSAAASKADIAALAPAVIAAAESDPQAASIIAAAARHLAEHAAALHARLGPWSSVPVLALSGGLLQPGGLLRERFLSELERWELPLQLLDREVDAARGAAALARSALTG